MKNIKLFMGLLIMSMLAGSLQLQAALTGDQYKNIIGRGIATDEAKPMDAQTLSDFKARGFDNIRLRVDANVCYTSSHLNKVVGIVERALDAGLVPIVAWNNNDAEGRASSGDKADYIAWWTLTAIKLAGLSDKVSYNLFLEISNGSPLRDDDVKYNSWAQAAKDVIRAIEPNRMIITNSPNKKSKGLTRIYPSLYENDNYMMAEWHLYASGPNQRGGQKNWEGDGSPSDRNNVTSEVDSALAWTARTGINTYFGAWMPYSQYAEISDDEARSFGTFFLEVLSDARIPWTVNAIGNLYDDDNHEWWENRTKSSAGKTVTYNMTVLVDIMVSVGDFLWDDGGTAPEAPTAPSGLTASATSCSSVNLSWSDNSNNEDNFVIKQSVNGGGYSVIATVSANTTNYSVSGLNENTTYRYKVNAVNSAGSSSSAVSSNENTPSCPVNTHSLTVEVSGNGTVNPGSGSYNDGSVVSLTATPDPGYQFSGWSGDLSGTNNPASLAMDSDKSVTAIFVEESTGPITTTVTASGDAYVRNGSYSSTNYGSSAELQVKTTSNANAKRFSYIQFDLSNIGAVTSAQLKVKSIGNENTDIKVYTTSDGWGEGSIMWSNKPAFGNLEATFNIGANGTYTVDVTSYVAAQANGDNTASFALKCATSRLMTLSSKEGSYAPRLVIEHDGSPSTAVSEVTGNISMYPNPTTGIVNIDVNDEGFIYGTVKVVNAYGAIIETQTITDQQSSINIQDYNTGLYYIVVDYNNTTITRSIIKN